MKMKKLVALFTAAALCLGMSMTALAASETDNSRSSVPTAAAGDTAGYGYAVKNMEYDEADLKQIADAADAAIREQLAIPVKADVKLIVVGDYELYDKDGVLIPDGVVPTGNEKFYFGVPAGEDTSAYYHGAPIYVTHEYAPGKWEIIQGQVVKTVNGTWMLEVSMNDFSPIAIFKVMSDGSIKEVTYKDGKAVPKAQGKSAGVAGAKTSPKTGE